MQSECLLERRGSNHDDNKFHSQYVWTALMQSLNVLRLLFQCVIRSITLHIDCHFKWNNQPPQRDQSINTLNAEMCSPKCFRVWGACHCLLWDCYQGREWKQITLAVGLSCQVIIGSLLLQQETSGKFKCWPVGLDNTKERNEKSESAFS